MSITEIWRMMVEGTLRYLPRVGVSLLVFFAFWMAGRGVDRIDRRLGLSRRIDPDVTGLLAASAKVAMVILGTITAVGTLGVEVTAMVAGLGLTGLALGLAMKEIVSNALAGVLILIYRPFKRRQRHRGAHVSGNGRGGEPSLHDHRIRRQSDLCSQHAAPDQRRVARLRWHSPRRREAERGRTGRLCQPRIRGRPSGIRGAGAGIRGWRGGLDFGRGGV